MRKIYDVVQHGIRGKKMSIKSVPPVNNALKTGSETLTDETITPDNNITPASESSLDKETQQALDNATGLAQTIVSDKITNKIIRKIPSDEYLHLLNLLEEIISGSIDKKV